MAEYIVKPYNDDDEETIIREWHPEELIRCKDCKKHGTYDCPVKDSYDGEIIPYRTDDNFYCADGEEKGR